jgi:hypothetical protein
MKDWSLTGLIITIVVGVFLLTLVASLIKIDPVFMQGVSGTEAMTQAGLGQYANGEPVSLLQLIWNAIGGFLF